MSLIPTADEKIPVVFVTIMKRELDLIFIFFSFTNESSADTSGTPISSRVQRRPPECKDGVDGDAKQCEQR